MLCFRKQSKRVKQSRRNRVLESLSPEMAQISGKDLIPNSFVMSREDIAGHLGMVWELIKAPLIVPVLRLSVYVCLAMALMLFCERVYMGIVIVLVKLFWQKPAKRYRWEPIEEDVESGSSNFPFVLVQIPMYNEKEVTPPLDLAVTPAHCTYLSENKRLIVLVRNAQTGVQDFDRSGVRAVLAGRPPPHPSPRRLDRSHNQGNP